MLSKWKLCWLEYLSPKILCGFFLNDEDKEHCVVGLNCLISRAWSIICPRLISLVGTYRGRKYLMLPPFYSPFFVSTYKLPHVLTKNSTLSSCNPCNFFPVTFWPLFGKSQFSQSILPLRLSNLDIAYLTNPSEQLFFSCKSCLGLVTAPPIPLLP